MRAILCCLLALLIPSPLPAAWVDDWLTQKTTTSPNYLAGQQRGYYSGGGFNARWQSKVDYPVTVEMPRIKSGCGGIDVFMGGFSFLNEDYLVDKLQSILEGAPAVAFDLALKTLCEQCANTIKNFEALADKLNSMQLDECAAAKELVGVVMDENGFHSTEVMQERLGTSIKENKLTQGVSEMWDIATKEDEANNNVPQSGDVSRVTSGCNGEITATFLNSGFLLENIGGKLSLPANYTNLLRGLVGDVKLEGPATAYRVSYIPPCPENNPDDLKAFASGNVYAKDTGGGCSLIGDANRDLVTYVSKILSGIADKIESKGALSSDETTFLGTNPLAALPIIKTAVATNMKEATIAGLADITARAYSLQILSDLYIRGEAVAHKAKEMLEKQAGPASGQPKENCQAAIFAENADRNLTLMLERIRHLQKTAREGYLASTKELSAIMEYLEHMQRVEKQMVAEITRRYGKDVVTRAAY